MAFSLDRNFPSTGLDNIAARNFLSTRIVSKMEKKRKRKIQMCHIISYNTGRLEKNPTLWIQNDSLSFSCAGEQQVFRYCPHPHQAVGQRGAGGGERARVTHPS